MSNPWTAHDPAYRARVEAAEAAREEAKARCQAAVGIVRDALRQGGASDPQIDSWMGLGDRELRTAPVFARVV